MLIMPITGFIGASFGKHGVAFFGINLPNWLTPNQAISSQLFEVHVVVSWILVGLIALHILGALKHLLINKNKVFQRMWI
jgi:cytochrome b561